MLRRERRPRAVGWARTVVLAACVSHGACADEAPASDRRPDDAPERRLPDARLTVEWEVSGALQDTTLLQIGALAADAGGVSMLDPMRHQVLRFGRSGELLWAFGGPGAGPGEFLHALDVRMDGVGRTWVLDDRSLRITVIEEDGSPAFRVPLGELGGLPNGFVPLAADRVLVTLFDPRRPLALLGRDGRLVARQPFPWPDFEGLDAIRGQFAVASLAGSERWVAAFVLQDAFFGFDGLAPLGYRGWYVEPVPPPVVEERTSREGRSDVRERTLVSAVTAARGVALSPRRLYVLFGGTSPRRGRIVDAYRPDSGEYVESFLLPKPAARIAWGGGRLYATGVDPLPFLMALRRREGPLP